MYRFIQIQERIKSDFLSNVPKDKEVLGWLIISTFNGLIMRLFFITRDFWHDEAFQVLYSKLPLYTIFGGNDVHPPLFTLITKGIVWFTTDPLFLRLVILIMFFMFAFIFYDTLRQWFGTGVATFSYVLLMFSPTFALYSTEFRSYAFVLLLTILQIKHFNRMIDGNIFSALYYIFLSLAMICSHYMAGLILLVQIVYLLMIKGVKALKLLPEYLMISLGSIPLIIYVYKTLPKINSFWFENIDLVSYISTYSFLINQPHLTLFHIFTIFIFVLIITLFIQYKDHINKYHVQMILYIFLPITIMWIFSQFMPFYHHRYFLFGGVMIFALAGYTINELHKIKFDMYKAILIVLIFMVVWIPMIESTPINNAVGFLDNQNEKYSTIHTTQFSATPFKALTKNMNNSYILTQLTKKQIFTSGGAVIDYENEVYSNFSQIPKTENMYWVSDIKLYNHTVVFQEDGLIVQRLKYG